MSADVRELKERLVFAIAMDPDNAGCTIMVGISKACYAEMGGAVAKDADLTPVGIPVKLIIFGCEDREDGMRILKEGAAAVGAEFAVEAKADFSIKDTRVKN